MAFVQDLFNNIGRHCDIPMSLSPDDNGHRIWKVKTRVETKKIRGYMVQNIWTNKCLVVPTNHMYNLY